MPAANCFPLVCDLATAGDLPAVLAQGPKRPSPRLLTFFGMIPNFDPPMILPKLASLVRRGDLLLFSANLAPGDNYVAGVRKVLPQYDNVPTREWLLTFLLDLGIERRAGKLVFSIEPGAAGLRRIVARFHFNRAARFAVDSHSFAFRRGDSLRLFFSYRHTPARIRKLLGRHGLEVAGHWITRSAEEGVFLCHQG